MGHSSQKCEMKKREIVARPLLPADEEAAEPVEPAVCSLHDPAPGFEVRDSPNALGFLAARTDVGRIIERPGSLLDHREVVGLVQAKVLPPVGADVGPLDRDARDRRLEELRVVAIGSIDGDAEDDAPALTEQSSLDASFCPVGGIGPGFFPRPTGTWSSLRPSTASAT